MPKLCPVSLDNCEFVLVFVVVKPLCFKARPPFAVPLWLVLLLDKRGELDALMCKWALSGLITSLGLVSGDRNFCLDNLNVLIISFEDGRESLRTFWLIAISAKYCFYDIYCGLMRFYSL